MIRKKTSKLSVPDAILIDDVDKNGTDPSPRTTHVDFPKLTFAADVKWLG